jgi:hypothetical protein
MDMTSLELFYGKIIAIQGEIMWSEKYIIISNKNITTAVLRNPPKETLVKEILKDIPGQQYLFG